MSIKINFNKPLIGLDGKVIPDSNIGQTIATLLSQSPKGDSAKYMDWARKLYPGETIELDRSDKRVLYDFIKSHEGIMNILKDAALEIMDEAEKNTKDKPAASGKTK